MTEQARPSVWSTEDAVKPCKLPMFRWRFVAKHPLGPLLRPVAGVPSFKVRCMAAMVLAGASVLMIVAGSLDPSPTGLGTHQQLGLPPCSSVVLTGYPCPTCGMTTAFAHTVRGEFVSAFKAQPAGLGLALAAIVTGVLAAWSVLTGRGWSVNWYRLTPFRIAIVMVVLLVASWGFKIALGWANGTIPVPRS